MGQTLACQFGSGQSQPWHTNSTLTKNRDSSLRRRCISFLRISGPLHGSVHSLGQCGGAGFGRESDKRTHGGDLIVVLLDTPVEGSAVLGTDQRLRRTHTLGHVRHIQPVSVYRVVEVAAALLLDTKTVNTFSGITSEDF